MNRILVTVFFPKIDSDLELQNRRVPGPPHDNSPAASLEDSEDPDS